MIIWDVQYLSWSNKDEKMKYAFDVLISGFHHTKALMNFDVGWFCTTLFKQPCFNHLGYIERIVRDVSQVGFVGVEQRFNSELFHRFGQIDPVEGTFEPREGHLDLAET